MRIRPVLRLPRGAVAQSAALLTAFAAGCGGSDGPVIPTVQAPPFYQLLRVDNRTPPFPTYSSLGVTEYLVRATLSPLSTGRPLDERFTGGRGEGGGVGGPTRDTTVAIGQMSDVRWYSTGVGTREIADSAVVDVVLKDTVFIITRPDPIPSRTRADTGYLVNGMLVIPTRNTRNPNGVTSPMLLIYQLMQRAAP